MAEPRPRRGWTSYINRMQPTNDFEIRFLAREDMAEIQLIGQQGSHRPLPGLPRINDPDHVLYCRGQVVGHLPSPGEQIEAQFKTEHGYVLFISSREGNAFLSMLHVWYLRRDLSVADCLDVIAWDLGRDDCTPDWLAPSLVAVAHLEGMGEVGPPPLDGLVVENDHSVLFRVRPRGWYRLSLFDSRPRRFKFSNVFVGHSNSKLWNRRHIRARRFAPWEPVPRKARDVDKALDRQHRAERERELERERARVRVLPAAIGVQRVRQLSAMEPIDDFELWEDRLSSRFGDFKDDEPPWLRTPPAIHPRFEAQSDVSWESDWLMYRGHLIPNVRVEGERIEAQFRTPFGYLLFVSANYPLNIYYIPADFSGAEWAYVSPDWAYVEEVTGDRENLTVEVEDESNVCFSFQRSRWYRLLLFENPPRRCKRSDKSVWHRTSEIGQPRYFRILRHRRRPPM